MVKKCKSVNTAAVLADLQERYTVSVPPVTNNIYRSAVPAQNYLPERHSTAFRHHYSQSTYDFIFISHSNYASIYYRFWHIAAYWSKIATPLYLAPPLGVKPSDLRNDPSWRKTRWWAYQIVKELRWYVQPFWYKSRVWQTDGRNWRGIYAL